MRGGFETRLVLHEINTPNDYAFSEDLQNDKYWTWKKKLSRKKKTVIFLKIWINVRVCWCVKLNLTSVFYIHLVEALNPIWQSTDLLLCILNLQLPTHPCGTPCICTHSTAGLKSGKSAILEKLRRWLKSMSFDIFSNSLGPTRNVDFLVIMQPPLVHTLFIAVFFHF